MDRFSELGGLPSLFFCGAASGGRSSIGYGSGSPPSLRETWRRSSLKVRIGDVGVSGRERRSFAGTLEPDGLEEMSTT